ncbi:MAG: hypothetical protein AB7J13_04310 [Pyrinomonadaceae bacterium]
MRVKVKRVRPEYASINPRGEIVLNPSVFRLLGGINYVSLHFEDERRLIAIARPTMGGRIYNVMPYGRGGRLRVIRARLFTRELGIHIPETLVFTEIRSDVEGILILNLGTARPSRRAIAWGERGEGTSEK